MLAIGGKLDGVHTPIVREQILAIHALNARQALAKQFLAKVARVITNLAIVQIEDWIGSVRLCSGHFEYYSLQGSNCLCVVCGRVLAVRVWTTRNETPLTATTRMCATRSRSNIVGHVRVTKANHSQ